MRQLIRSGIFRRIALAILLVSFVPLLVIGGVAMRTGSEAGAESITISREVLNAKSAEALELRVVETSISIANFLERCEADLRALALLPRTADAYLAFSRVNQGDLWSMENGHETHQRIPLYSEIAYVNANGYEVIKITDDRVAGPSELHDVSDPSNTLYKSEPYFNETRKLANDEIYVSHLSGYYVSQAEFEAGVRYQGVIRFAVPVFDENNRFDGIVVMALDSRHLAEFTVHIVPTDQRFAVKVDVKTGNYAYMIDDKAQTIVHPNEHYIWGVARDGQTLPYTTRPEDIGNLPIRLDLIGFADENLASIPARVASGEAGSIQYTWQGHDKFATFAPIPYYGGSYSPPTGFGWVGFGADMNTFHQAATLVGDAIMDIARTLGYITLASVAFAGVLVLASAGVLAQQISQPLRQIIEAARRVERNEFQLDILDPLLEKQSGDEIVHLAHVFNEMAIHVARREQLRRLLDVVISIGVALPEERNFHRLLETVVLEAKSLCNADAGTLYLRTAEDELEFMIVRNDSLNIAMGGISDGEIPYPAIPLYDENGAENHANVASHTFHSGTTINISDAYLELGTDFTRTRTYDAETGYHSKSFLSVPLRDSSNEIIGVLQLINARDSDTGEFVAFEKDMNRVIESLASLGTVALKAYMREEQLRQQIEELRIEIDEVRKAQQVTEITETEYFQQLQERARGLRSKRNI
ncbi:MAG: GAF domain-containing protein [Anaerolineales bacterium]|nr:GAF domain-containing protein [Anaerolineales bacterium]